MNPFSGRQNPGNDDQPAEIITGIRRIFSVPALYRAAQSAIGADHFRTVLVDEILRLSPNDRVLDIGCGTADILDHLPEADYIGYDHSADYIADAKRRYGNRGTFIVAGASGDRLELDDHRSVAFCIGVLHHLDDEQVVEALTMAREALVDGGRFVSIDPTFTDGQHPVGRFLASRDRGQHVRSPHATSQLVESVFRNVSVTVRHDLLRVPYSHVIAEARG